MALDLDQLRAIMSGRRRGPAAMLARTLAAPASWLYAAGVRWRNWRYDANPKRTERVDRPVISIGNITTGGTGKTPMVEWIARWFRERQIRVAIVSRGYGAEQGAQNDEAMELEQRLPDVPHLQNPDRVAAARIAIEELDSELILLDDALQHRRIHRDLNIVLIDALTPFGYGHVLPRGLLREPLAGLARADLIILSRADQVDAARRDEIRAAVTRYAPDAAWAECAHQPNSLLSHRGSRESCDALQHARCGAFCGIGNPDGFRATLADLTAGDLPWKTFPDHHSYTRDDIQALTEWAREHQLERVVCTHKDLVKVGLDRLGSVELSALVVQVEFIEGAAVVEEGLGAVMEDLTQRRRDAED